MLRHNFRCRGFLFLSDKMALSEPEEYFDFYSKQWTELELEADLTAANLPNGMIVSSEAGSCGVVMPDLAEGGQKVEPINKVLSEGLWEKRLASLGVITHLAPGGDVKKTAPAA